MINGDTGLVGLLGNPVRHSLSPAMHNAALQALQLNWSYLALPCTSQNLQEVLQGLRAVNCRGLNVTIPHKQDVAELCQELSPLAKRLGAVNTLIPLDSGGWHGTNTDVEGFLTPLGEQSSWQNCHGVIIGCGGSARAIAAGLQSLRLASITVIGRRQEALDAFIADLQSNDAPLTACLQSSPKLARRASPSASATAASGTSTPPVLFRLASSTAATCHLPSLPATCPLPPSPARRPAAPLSLPQPQPQPQPA